MMVYVYRNDIPNIHFYTSLHKFTTNPAPPSCSRNNFVLLHAPGNHANGCIRKVIDIQNVDRFEVKNGEISAEHLTEVHQPRVEMVEVLVVDGIFRTINQIRIHHIDSASVEH